MAASDDSRESRYEILAEIASGGMATVFVGRLRGAGGFSRLVAIKRAHRHIVEDIHTRKMMLEEARHASMLHHPCAVAVVDVEDIAGELRLVMDYVEGGSLAQLITAAKETGTAIPVAVCVRIALDACAGLHAAHELCDELDTPRRLIHRDVTPQNILVGIDGLARVTDFGIAKSVESQLGATVSDELKGKIAYMAPEYVDGKPVDARIDVFGLGVTLWESLANRRLFRGGTAAETLKLILDCRPPPMREVARHVPEELEGVVLKALARDRDERFVSAAAFAAALREAATRCDRVADTSEVAETVRTLLADALASRRGALRNKRVGEAPRPAPPRPADGELSTLGASGVSSRIRPSSASRRRTTITVLGIGLAAAAAVAVYMIRQPTPPSERAPALNAETARPEPPAAPALSHPVTPTAEALPTSTASAPAPSVTSRPVPFPRVIAPAPSPAASFDPNPYKR